PPRPLALHRGREQLAARRVRARPDEAERDRGGGRAEPSLERDAVDEAKVPPLGIRQEGVRACPEVGRVGGELVRTHTLDLDARTVGELELVPEVERDAD